MLSKIKSKLKSFFTLPEEVLQEEPSKTFEKVKLFTLTRTNLFITIAALFIMTNLLVGFDINFLCIRAILAFIFLITIPGLLLMLVFKIQEVKFWEYLVYTIGLSISFIMFAGLAVNWILPVLNITDKPLSLWPILICFDIFLVALGIIAWRRNRDLKPFDITTPKLDWINNIFFIVPMIFPVLSILGAFLLNNHGSNILTMIMLGGIAVYVFCLVLFRKKLNENVWPWAILMISISLLLSFSLRSWYISGWDISQETYVFRTALDNGFWSMQNWNNAYNACLSLSILPAIIKFFTSASINLTFKLFFQIIFLFHLLTVFLIFKRYIPSTLAFLSSFLYFGTLYFNSIFTMLMRQEIAFLFFGLMLLVLFNKEINRTSKKVLFVVFGFSMIISHYSTTYIAISFFLLTYIITYFYNLYKNRNKSQSDPPEFFLTGVLILLLLIFTFFWLTQLTNTSSGLNYTLKTTVENIGNTFTWDSKSSAVQSALFGWGTIGYTTQELNSYINKTKSLLLTSDIYSEQQTKNYPSTIINIDTLQPNNKNIAYLLFYTYQFIKYSIIISFILGSFFIFINRDKIIHREFIFMILISILLISLIIILPFISKVYNFQRLFQQCLIFLSFSSIIFFRKIFSNPKIFTFFILFLYLGYFLFNLGFLLSLSGGGPSLNLYNEGQNYLGEYSHTEELTSTNWLDKSNPKDIIYMDPYSELKFYAFGNPLLNHNKIVTPPLMLKSSYVYSSYANKIHDINNLDARDTFNNGVLSFNFPIDFLDYNKNKIYNNGGSEIFK